MLASLGNHVIQLHNKNIPNTHYFLYHPFGQQNFNDQPCHFIKGNARLLILHNVTGTTLILEEFIRVNLNKIEYGLSPQMVSTTVHVNDQWRQVNPLSSMMPTEWPICHQCTTSKQSECDYRLIQCYIITKELTM